jgi:2-polyprenyl-3-methyl-5-hydroxy-6-metoxy-1,4-benzoquinol methylase
MTNKIFAKKWYGDKNDLLREVITDSMDVLDVGFWGQGIPAQSPHWPHRTLKESARSVEGIDIEFEEEELLRQGLDPKNYHRCSAEDFDLNKTYDVIFAGDLIEHLSNPGLFLESCLKHLKEDGFLLITTPNTYNLFSMAGKLTRPEPIVNSDHTCYFNTRTLSVLLKKNKWKATEVAHLYSVGVIHKESFKKKFLNLLYLVLSKFTTKFMEDFAVIARKS